MDPQWRQQNICGRQKSIILWQLIISLQILMAFSWRWEAKSIRTVAQRWSSFKDPICLQVYANAPSAQSKWKAERGERGWIWQVSTCVCSGAQYQARRMRNWAEHPLSTEQQLAVVKQHFELSLHSHHHRSHSSLAAPSKLSVWALFQGCDAGRKSCPRPYYRNPCVVFSVRIHRH